jgi:hypothetical protein
MLWHTAAMGRKDVDPGHEPSLELPSFRLGRKKRQARQEPATPARARAPEPTPQRMLGSQSSRSDVDALTTRREIPRISGESGRPAGGVSGAGHTPEPPHPGPAAGGGRPRGFALRAASGRIAAVVTGLVIGLLAVGLVFGSLRVCEAARGTASCGGGPGLLLLVAVLVLLTYLGSWLLRGFGLRDPGSTSFLAVALLAVAAMLFLIEVLTTAWMVVVIPLVAAGAYALSHWVTTALVDGEQP